MSKQITKKQLQAIVDRVNRITKSPMEPCIKTPDGKVHAQIGNYHLNGACGGYALHRMHNESGGIEDVLQCGHVSKRELYLLIHAFIRGIEMEEI